MFDGFSGKMFRQSRSSFARLITDYNCKPFIFCAGPDRCFTKPRPTEHSNLVRVNCRVRFEIVQSPAQCPSPGTDPTEIVIPILQFRVALPPSAFEACS